MGTRQSLAEAMIPAIVAKWREHGDDVLELSHEALSRRSFAEGAVRAAEWLCGKTGCYDFSQIYSNLP